MLAKTVKKQCTFAHSRAIKKLFHIGQYIGRFIGQYWVICWLIFQIPAVFLLQMIWRTIFPYRIGSRQKRRYRL